MCLCGLGGTLYPVRGHRTRHTGRLVHTYKDLDSVVHVAQHKPEARVVYYVIRRVPHHWLTSFGRSITESCQKIW